MKQLTLKYLPRTVLLDFYGDKTINKNIPRQLLIEKIKAETPERFLGTDTLGCYMRSHLRGIVEKLDASTVYPQTKEQKARKARIRRMLNDKIDDINEMLYPPYERIRKFKKGGPLWYWL